MATCVFVRATGLSNSGGREAYADGSTGKQENLLYSYSTLPDGFEKEPYFDALRQHRKETSKKLTVEERSKQTKILDGREIMMSFDMALMPFSDEEYKKLSKKLESWIRELTGMDVMFMSFHLNQKKNNFHVHIIVPEYRLREGAQPTDVKRTTFTRNTYFNAEGSRSSKKACTDEKGNLLEGCTFYPKGSTRTRENLFSGDRVNLGKKNITFQLKEKLADYMNEELGVKKYCAHKEKGKLSQQHIGKNLTDEQVSAIERKNENIARWNEEIDKRNQLSAICNKYHDFYELSDVDIKIMQEPFKAKDKLQAYMNHSDHDAIAFQKYDSFVEQMPAMFSQQHDQLKEKIFSELNQSYGHILDEAYVSMMNVQMMTSQIHDNEKAIQMIDDFSSTFSPEAHLSEHDKEIISLSQRDEKSFDDEWNDDRKKIDSMYGLSKNSLDVDVQKKWVDRFDNAGARMEYDIDQESIHKTYNDGLNFVNLSRNRTEIIHGISNGSKELAKTILRKPYEKLTTMRKGYQKQIEKLKNAISELLKNIASCIKKLKFLKPKATEKFIIRNENHKITGIRNRHKDMDAEDIDKAMLKNQLDEGSISQEQYVISFQELEDKYAPVKMPTFEEFEKDTEQEDENQKQTKSVVIAKDIDKSIADDDYDYDY